MTAEMVAAEDRLSRLVQRANNRHDFCVVTRLRLTLYTAVDQSDRGVDVFLDWLRQHGTVWSNHPTRDDVDARVRTNLDAARQSNRLKSSWICPERPTRISSTRWTSSPKS